MSQNSLFTGIRQLPPGAVMELQIGNKGVQAKETLPAALNATATPPRTNSSTIRNALTQSVHDHLIADVPVAVALSGGTRFQRRRGSCRTRNR